MHAYDAPNLRYHQNVVRAIDLWDSYYDRLGETPLYVASIILDPRLKDGFFRRANWEQREIDIHMKSFYMLYNGYKNNLVMVERISDRSERSFFDEFYKRQDDTKDEVQRYLSQDVEDAHTKPSAWWKLNSHTFPTLSAFAKDVLSAPATSVSTERTFSFCRDVISVRRSSLSPSTFSALMFLKINRSISC
jgi:hypothetical protein